MKYKHVIFMPKLNKSCDLKKKIGSKFKPLILTQSLLVPFQSAIILVYFEMVLVLQPVQQFL